MGSSSSPVAATAGAEKSMDLWAERKATTTTTLGLGSSSASEHQHRALGNSSSGSRRSYMTGGGVAAAVAAAAAHQSRRHAGGGDAEEDKEMDDEEALKWAALEKLPTYDRLRTSILQKFLGSKIIHQEVDVRHIGFAERQRIIDNLLKVADEDNERFLLKLRHRIDRVGIHLPTLEVRYENLTIDANCFVGDRALPTLKNATLNFVEAILDTVGLSPTKKTVLNILDNVSGILEPARMTLLLGPPSSGKTSLLLALAGKLDKDLKVKGKVTYNGHMLNEFVPQKTSAYISQHDLHVGEMTVRETLDFSARCQGVGTRYEMLLELAKREKQHGIFPEKDVDVYMKATAVEGMQSSISTDYIMKILGLDICADILVGDNMHRGISGGQKKRVTTGEMIVGPTTALFMDEISTGQVVYHGPKENVLEFFRGCGFKCPERKGIADFLQEVTSQKDQEQYWDRHQPYRYVSVKHFAELFQTFHIGKRMEAELMVPYQKERSHKAALSFYRYSVSNWELFKANFAKEWLLMKRNSFVYIFKTVQIGVVALISMSVFFRTTLRHDTQEDGATYLGAIFFGIIIIMFNGYAELSMTIFRLPVFYKQRDLLFYPAWAYALPSLVLSIPSSIAEAGMYSLITYYGIGYAPELSRFLRAYLLLFVIHQLSSSMFRLIAGLCRTMVVANTGGTFALLIIFMLAGFIIPEPRIKAWWIWGYWSSPVAYAEKALTVNEFLAPQWAKPITNSNRTLGQQVLFNSGIPAHAYWYWIGLAALVGYVFLFYTLYTLALTYLNPLGKPQAIVSEEALAQRNANRTGKVALPSLHHKSRKLLPRSLSRDMDGVGVPVKLVVEGEKQDGQGVLVQQQASSRALTIDSTEAAAAARPKHGMILPFHPLTISFKNIKYFVDMPAEMKKQGVIEDKLQLLCGVTGVFRPGVLTALVGVSGAGKTTLMDVLGGRKTGGYIEGEIRICGHPKRQQTFARISGYCEQNDIHSPQVTVKESIVYSAWLRLPPEIGKETREKFVEEVMELVELVPLQNALVGLPGMTGLSTEQLKRLTIAVELVANPSIIFMDEPTSGLDARAAAIVMRTVRNTVDTGRTVVCTIHQPSIDIFEAFDEMLLMKRGGQVIYMGPLGHHSHNLIEYFEAIPGVPSIKEGYNPATWMLDVTSNMVEQQLSIDFAEIYRRSDLHQRNKEMVEIASNPVAGSKDLYFRTQYSQSFWTQIRACLWKQHWTYWRSPDYNCVRLFFTFVSAVLFGTIFWNIGKKTAACGSH
ncbi:hypothetical protein BDL97_09G061300 [Sphagnum fallax]|nr:hypothetical protein BDL97_09G061300 [Sphagnum fallax]